MQHFEQGDGLILFWESLTITLFLPGNSTATSRRCPQWGRFIRSSPQSDPELLEDLDQFSPPWDVPFPKYWGLEPVEFYDVIQWLKASSKPQHHLINRWQEFLRESMVRKGVKYSDDKLEQRWQENLKREADFHGPLQAFDKEVIRCWESCLEAKNVEEKNT
ncbi:hypothetical protein B0H14DRAFT_290703 [Mycena olivaceomarginata]|nr:hypothetical protein B0H14DRAFT_290703 [Mycena olivaceomarginata]